MRWGGAPGRIRTADAHLRTVPLYPLSYGGAAAIVPATGPCGDPDYNPVAMTDAPLPDLILYTRAECGLCGDALATVTAILAERRAGGLPTPTLVERDIDRDPAWHDANFAVIPVVELDGRRLETVIGVAKLRRLLAETLDGVATAR